MGVHRTEGFTIIEVTLFLAISGLLIVLMIAGSGATISAQRYKDANETLKTLIQQQYSKATNVQNDRDDSVACQTATASIGGGSSNPGQSKCLIMGRFMYLNDKDVKLYDVIGYAPSSIVTVNDNDFDALRKYTLNVSQVSLDSKEMDWSTTVRSHAASGAGASTKLGILFIRAPDTGNLYTLTTTAVPADPASLTKAHFAAMINAGSVSNAQKPQYLCVNSDGSIPTESVSAVYIGQNAASASAVEIYSNNYMKTQGMAVQC